MNARADFDPRRWSLALRLTLFLSVAMGVILLAVAWAMDQQLNFQLHEKDEVELSHALEVQRGIARSLAGIEGSESWPRVWMTRVQRSDGISIRVLTPDGHVIGETPGMSVPVDAFVLDPPHRFKRWEPADGTGTRYLLTSGPWEAGPGRIGAVQVAEDLTQSHELLETFRRRLMLVLAAAAVVVILVGRWLVHRGLAPLRAMSEEIASVDAATLHARIGAQPWPEDLQSLAQTFDAMLQRLETAFEQLSRFSSDLAHEFRSPITNLVAAASVMLRRPRSVGEYQETLAVMVEEGERLSRMVSSMLFLARADNATQAMNPERISLADEFAHLVEAFEPLADERGVTLSASGDCSVVADPLLLRRALTNLIVNAFAHTPEGGRIELQASEATPGAELTVSDTGDGIAPQHLSRIFDRFYRVDAARSSTESTGLGLSLVQSIVEMHGATVRVESTVGAGTRFTISWPGGAGHRMREGAPSP
jgi:two-component system heavy metal sensor histidine kinase CusS